MWKKENLRKNFLRVKQIADQNLGRAEKSEVLTEDQQGNEKRVDVVKQVSHNLVKKVGALLETPPGTEYEKRLKKLPETSLSNSLMEAAAQLGPDTLMGIICQLCGDCQYVLAKEELQCELDIEREVVTPLQTIAEVDFPSITKLRKQLSKSTLDMDSAKSRFNSAVRQSHVPGANMASAAAKADAVRDEYDEACNKVETIKDNLSIELCNFISKESEHSSRLLALLEAQATYHKNALTAIEETIPKLKSTIETSAAKPMFGMALEDHLHVMDRDISLVLEACILALLETGMEEEGLFRIAGSALKMKKLKACFDAHAVDMDDFITDPHTVAGVLKQYLRELPEPMLTFEQYSEFMQATQLPHEQKFQALYSALGKLPSCNYNNFRYLVKFLAVLAEKNSVNKMTPSNIAIVMGPNLLWAKGENTPNMLTAGTVSSVIEIFILHADYFFPGAVDFHLTGRGRAPSPAVPTTPPANQPPLVSSVRGDNPVQGGEEEETAELLTPCQKSPSMDNGTKSSTDGMLRGVSAGDRGLPVHSTDTVLPPLTPPTHLSLAGSALRQRPTMSSPTLGPQGAPATLSTPNLSQEGAVSVGSGWPNPASPMSPGQSVHSDMYSTLFALHSLGEGDAVWSDYLTRVRALWDEQFQSASLRPASAEGPPGSQRGSDRRDGPAVLVARSGEKVSCPPKPAVEAEWRAEAEAGQREEMGGAHTPSPSPQAKARQDIEFSVTGSYPPDSPAQELGQESLSMATHSPAMAPHSPASASASPVAANTSPSVIVDTLSVSTESPEGLGASPKIPRRVTKKPAPPPPMDRPSPASVGSSVARVSGNGGVSWQAGHPAVPVISPDHLAWSASQPADGEKRLSGSERPHGPPPERPNTRPPERPKAPATLQSTNQPPAAAPGGHQRSASTGAMNINLSPGSSAGSASHESLQANASASFTVGQGNAMPSGTATLGRHSTMRPARPQPPPPPPPINKQSEETYL